jgi:hypothetical protein
MAGSRFSRGVAATALVSAAACASIAGVEDLTIYDGGVDAGDSDAAAADASPDSAPGAITWRATTTQTVPGDQPVSSLTLSRPATAAAGDVLIAGIAMGFSGAPTTPVFTPPQGWTLVRRIDDATLTTLAIYWHAQAASEPASYTWSFDMQLEGVAWMSDYAGVDTTTPFTSEDGGVVATMGTSYSTPKIQTTAANALVLATFTSHCCSTGSSIPMWNGPMGMVVRANLNNDSTRAALAAEVLVAAPGNAGPYTATVNVPQDYALTDLLALLPAR